LDESSQYSAVKIKGRSAHFNLAGVSYINSIGIRNWVKFLSSHPGVDFEFSYCPEAFLDAAAIFDHLLGPKRDPLSLKSGKVPFVCEQCDHDWSLVFAQEDLVPESKRKNLQVQCPNCSSKVPLDSTESSYLHLLDQVKVS
jgi:DNA-directed RNA polymerase subunit RPC12/RpoP